MMRFEEKYYKCKNDDEIYTEDDARDHLLEEMTWDDYREYFINNVSMEDIWERLRKLPEFFDTFENEIYEAEDEKFHDLFTECEPPKEDE